MVALSQKVLMNLSYHQTPEPFIFLNLKFQAAITNQGQQPSWPLSSQTSSISKQFSITEIQIFKLRKIKV